MLVARASYVPQENSPIGNEIALRGEVVYTYMGEHELYPGWWKVGDEEGNCGYVPGNRLKPYEKLTTLPWLEKKPEERASDVCVFGAPARKGW